jgi:hypothetical protein
VTDGERPDSTRARIREQRRLTLEARTIRITLEASLRGLAENQAYTDAQRNELRREWCARARELLDRVERLTARSRQVAGSGQTTAGSHAADLLQASGELDAALARARAIAGDEDVPA